MNKKAIRPAYGVFAGRTRAALLCCAFALGWAGTSMAQLVTPLQIGAAESIDDVFGDTIADHSLVHIMEVGSGIQEPAPDGSPQNAVIVGGEIYIGHGIGGGVEDTGLFGATIPNELRPAEDTELFVRVYNKPDTTNALFYADSVNAMTVSGDDVLLAFMGPMTNILHPGRDTDLDGIPDWWEYLKTIGNHTGLVAGVDYDGDGMTAWEEYIAGTDPFDAESSFFITSIAPLYSETNFVEHVWTDPGTGITQTQNIYVVEGEILSWPSVGGRAYRLEYTTNLVEGAYEQVPGATNLPATPPVNVFTNTYIPEENTPLYYRARVWLPE